MLCSRTARPARRRTRDEATAPDQGEARHPTTEKTSGSRARLRSAISKTAHGRDDASERPGTNGLQATSAASPGKFGSRNDHSPTGNSPRSVTLRKCGSPQRESAAGPNPKPAKGVSPAPESAPAKSPCRTRASTISPSPPSRSARTAKCDMPLRRPFAGRLNTSHSARSPLPATPMHPAPIPPTGNETARRWIPFPCMAYEFRRARRIVISRTSEGGPAGRRSTGGPRRRRRRPPRPTRSPRPCAGSRSACGRARATAR